MTDSAAVNNYREALEKDGDMVTAQEQWNALCDEEKLYCTYYLFDSIRVKLGCVGVTNRHLNRLKFDIEQQAEKLLTSKNSTRQKGEITELPSDEEAILQFGEGFKQTLVESKRAEADLDDFNNPDLDGKSSEFLDSNFELSEAIDEVADVIVNDILRRMGLEKFGKYRHEEVTAHIRAGGVPNVIATMVIPDPITAFASLEELYNYRPTFTVGAGAGAGAESTDDA